MDKLGLYTYIDGINDTPFPSKEEQLVLNAFTYTSERMGGAPTISATAKHRLLLDNLWTDKVYVKFKEEMLFIRNTPSTTKDNADTRYSYEIEFLSDRDQLNRIYFIDAVQGNSGVDVYKSNSTKVLFMGTIYEFADRLKSCLAYFGLDYTVEVEDDLPTESKLVEFEDLYILSALQEVFNIYEIPYYFSGKKIHIGFASEATAGAIWEYNGNRGSLLSISRQNENYAIINKIKGVGSSDNIPFYYPNESADREEVEASGKTWITPMPNLMPSIYRESKGATMFYEAKNNTYTNEEGEYYVFENEFSENNQRQGSTNFEDIKPTIKEAVNALGYRMDMFSAFDYDRDDNDQLDEDNNYVHPYFYGKLRKFDGEYGFNLFDHAIEGDTMRFAMTSGVCGACEFELGVDEESGKNIIQVTDDGLLKRDSDGNVLLGEPQERQNDTQNYEVWVALKKEDTTYGQIMPNVGQNLRPSVNDTFVILGISMPQSYILRAEKKLEDSLIKHMFENNMEKFNFSIKFSKVYFRDNPGLTEPLNENAMVRVFYDGREYLLNVTSYTYKVDEGSVLPDVEVELAEKLTIGKNSLQMQLDAVKQDILSYVGNKESILKSMAKFFLRKDVSDRALAVITFLKGIVLGNSGYEIGPNGIARLYSALFDDGISSNNFSTGALGAGFCLKKDENGDSYLEVDRALFRKTATFIELLIQRLRYVGGQIILSPASMSCVKVEDKGGYYRCYFQNTDGDKTLNQEFVVGDLARSQTFNIKEGVSENVSNTYYWRAVVGVGDDYIDLSKSDCDSGSTIPQAGDDIVQLGNKTEAERQSAIVLAAYGNDAPYIKMYRGINNYVLDGKEFATFSRSEVDIIADKIRFSTGENVKEVLSQASTDASQAIEVANRAEESANKANEELGFIADDNYITPSEKTALKQQQADIQSERNEIVANATKYGVNYSAYETAYTAANNALTKYTASSPKNIEVGPDYADISAYYAARKTILDTIATAAKKLVTDIDDDLQSYKSTVTQEFEAVDGRFTSVITENKEYTDSVALGLDNKIEENSTKIEQLPDQISLTVDQKIENIQVGGRNYIQNSTFMNDFDKWNKYNFNGNFSIGLHNGKYSLLIERTGYSGSRRHGVSQTIDTNLNSGEYTLSLKYRSNQFDGTRNQIFVRIYSTASAYVDKGIITIPNTQGGDSDGQITFNVDSNIYKAELYVVLDKNGYLRVWEIKLEQGNKATDWSPAPEDIDNSLSTLSSEIKQTAESISLKVDKLQGGTNLLPGSKLTENVSGWNVNGSPDYSITTAQGQKCLVLSSYISGGGIWRKIQMPPQYKVKGYQFTISFDLYNPSNMASVRIGLEGAPSSQLSVDTLNKGTVGWVRLSATQEYDNIDMENFVIYSDFDRYSAIYIKHVKIEFGPYASNFTENESDVLLATGIDIFDRKLIFTADNTLIQDNSGNKIAMFTTTPEGKPLLAATNIDVDNLKVKHLEGAVGTFGGELVAATGSFANVTAENMTAQGSFMTRSVGSRVLLDSSSNAIRLVDSDDIVRGQFEFSNGEASLKLNSSRDYSTTLYADSLRISKGISNYISITPDKISLNGADGYTGVVNIKDGLDQFDNEKYIQLYIKGGIIYNVKK